MASGWSRRRAWRHRRRRRLGRGSAACAAWAAPRPAPGSRPAWRSRLRGARGLAGCGAVRRSAGLARCERPSTGAGLDRLRRRRRPAPRPSSPRRRWAVAAASSSAVPAAALISSTTLSALGSAGLIAPDGSHRRSASILLNSRAISAVVFFSGSVIELRRSVTWSSPVVLVDLALELAAHAADGADHLADALHQGGQFLGADEDQRKDADHQHLGPADTEHVECSLTPGSGPGAAQTSRGLLGLARLDRHAGIERAVGLSRRRACPSGRL